MQVLLVPPACCCTKQHGSFNCQQVCSEPCSSCDECITAIARAVQLKLADRRLAQS